MKTLVQGSYLINVISNDDIVDVVTEILGIKFVEHDKIQSLCYQIIDGGCIGGLCCEEIKYIPTDDPNYKVVDYERAIEVMVERKEKKENQVKN